MSSSSTPAPEPAAQDAAPAEPDGGWFGSASEAHRPVDPPKRAWRAYFEATQMLTEVLERRLKQDCGMSLADYNLLLLLYESPEGRLRLGELASRMVFSPSRITYQVKTLVARGLSTEQIARRLFLSPKTIRNRLSDLYRTLGVSNRAEAVAAAYELGM